MKKEIPVLNSVTPEKMAKAYFEYTGWDDLWMDGAWEELSIEVREERIERMKAAIERAHTCNG